MSGFLSSRVGLVFWPFRNPRAFFTRRVSAGSPPSNRIFVLGRLAGIFHLGDIFELRVWAMQLVAHRSSRASLHPSSLSYRRRSGALSNNPSRRVPGLRFLTRGIQARHSTRLPPCPSWVSTRRQAIVLHRVVS